MERSIRPPYSIPANVTLAKRAQQNIEGASCLTACGDNDTPPNPSDCSVVHNTLYNKAVRLTLGPSMSRFHLGSARLRHQTDKLSVKIWTNRHGDILPLQQLCKLPG
jgi:hypothetical protein